MADRFWISGVSSNWNSASNWAASSGGAGGAGVPTSSDNAIFDGNGLGNCVVDVSPGIVTLDIQTGYTGAIDNATNNPSYTLSGNLNIDSGATWTKGTGIITFTGAGSGTQNIDTNDKQLEDIVVNDDGAIKQLQSNIHTESITASTSNSTLSLAGYDATVLGDIFSTIDGNIINSSGSTLNVGGSYHCYSTLGGATINFTGTGNIRTSTNAFQRNFADWNISGSYTVSGGNAQIRSGTITISGSLDVSNQIFCYIGGIFKITGTGSLTGSGTLYFQNAGVGYISQMDGTCNIANITIARNQSNNTPNLILTPAAYDSNVLLTTDGGAPTHNSFWPAGSFTFKKLNYTCAAGSTLNVSANSTTITLKEGLGPTVSGAIINKLATGGDLAFIFDGTGDHTITTNGGNLGNVTIAKSSGSISLASDVAFDTLKVNIGTFNAVTYNVSAIHCHDNFDTQGTILMGTGTWTVSGKFDMFRLPSDPQTSTLIMTGDRTVNGARCTVRKLHNLTIAAGANIQYDRFASSSSHDQTGSLIVDGILYFGGGALTFNQKAGTAIQINSGGQITGSLSTMYVEDLVSITHSGTFNITGNVIVTGNHQNNIDPGTYTCSTWVFRNVSASIVTVELKAGSYSFQSNLQLDSTGGAILNFFNSTYKPNITVSGNLTIQSITNVNYQRGELTGTLICASATGRNLNTNNQHLEDMTIDTSGAFQLLSDMKCDSINLIKGGGPGALNLDGYTLTSGDFNVNAGFTINMNTGDIFCSGDFILDATAVWNKGTGTITFSGAGSGTQNIDTSNKDFEDIVVNDAGSTKQLLGALNTSNLTVTAGTFATNNQNISLSGSLVIDASATWTKGTGTITFAGAGAGTQTINSSGASLESVIINDAGATKQLLSDFAAESLLVSAGVFDGRNYNGDIAGNCNAYSVVNSFYWGGAGKVWNIGGDFLSYTHSGLGGTLNLNGTGKYFGTHNVYIQALVNINGSYSSYGHNSVTWSTLTIKNGGTYTNNHQQTIFTNSQLKIEAGGILNGTGNIKLQNNGSVQQMDGTFQQSYLWTVTQPLEIVTGTYDCDIYPYAWNENYTTRMPNSIITCNNFKPWSTIGKTCTIDMATNNCNLIIRGSLAPYDGNTTIAWTKGTGTITFSGSGDHSINSQGVSLEDIIINKNSSITLLSDLYTESFHLQNGSFDMNGFDMYLDPGNVLIDAIGTWLNSIGSSNIRFVGTGNQQITDNKGDIIDNVVVNKAGGTFTFVTNMNAWAIFLNQGLVDLGGKQFTTQSDFDCDSLADISPVTSLNGCVMNVGGNWNWSGSEGNLLNLNATATWTLNVIGNGVGDWVDVANSDASGGKPIIPTNSIDSGGNLNWLFPITVVKRAGVRFPIAVLLDIISDNFGERDTERVL